MGNRNCTLQYNNINQLWVSLNIKLDKISGQPSLAQNINTGLRGYQYLLDLNSQQSLNRQISIYQARKYCENTNVIKLYSAFLGDINYKFGRIQKSQKTFRIITEEIFWSLADYHNLSIEEGLYLLKGVVHGCRELIKHCGCFVISQKMIGINHQGIVKIWYNSHFAKNNFEIQNMLPNSQSDMITNIIKVIEPHIINQQFSSSIIYTLYKIHQLLECQKYISNLLKVDSTYQHQIGLNMINKIIIANHNNLVYHQANNIQKINASYINKTQSNPYKIYFNKKSNIQKCINIKFQNSYSVPINDQIYISNQVKDNTINNMTLRDTISSNHNANVLSKVQPDFIHSISPIHLNSSVQTNNYDSFLNPQQKIKLHHCRINSADYMPQKKEFNQQQKTLKINHQNKPNSVYQTHNINRCQSVHHDYIKYVNDLNMKDNRCSFDSNIKNTPIKKSNFSTSRLFNNNNNQISINLLSTKNRKSNQTIVKNQSKINNQFQYPLLKHQINSQQQFFNKNQYISNNKNISSNNTLQNAHLKNVIISNIHKNQFKKDLISQMHIKNKVDHEKKVQNDDKNQVKKSSSLNHFDQNSLNKKKIYTIKILPSQQQKINQNSKITIDEQKLNTKQFICDSGIDILTYNLDQYSKRPLTSIQAQYYENFLVHSNIKNNQTSLQNIQSQIQQKKKSPTISALKKFNQLFKHQNYKLQEKTQQMSKNMTQNYKKKSPNKSRQFLNKNKTMAKKYQIQSQLNKQPSRNKEQKQSTIFKYKNKLQQSQFNNKMNNLFNQTNQTNNFSNKLEIIQQTAKQIENINKFNKIQQQPQNNQQ